MDVPSSNAGRRNTSPNIPTTQNNIARNTNDKMNFEEMLFLVTDVVLVLCGIVVVISFIASVGIGILGLSRIHSGLDFYSKTFGWD